MLKQCDAIEIDLLHWKDRWIGAFSSFPHNRKQGIMLQWQLWSRTDLVAVQVLVARTRLYYHYAQLLNCAHAVQSISAEPDWADSAYAAKVNTLCEKTHALSPADWHP